jgi:hypothetical protein
MDNGFISNKDIEGKMSLYKPSNKNNGQINIYIHMKRYEKLKLIFKIKPITN